MSLVLSGTAGVSDVDGTATTPALRGTDTNTGIFFPAADTIAFSEGGIEVARFDSSGNLGLGVTPNSGWDTATPALQIKERLSLSGYLGNSWITNNGYNAPAGWRYLTSNPASQIRFSDNQILFNIAPSGTAGNAISFTQAMTLFPSGGLAVGATSDPGLNIRATGVNGFSQIGDGVFSSNRADGLYVIQQSNSPVIFYTNNTERARIDSSGQMRTTNGAGTVSLAYDARAWVNFNGTGTVSIRASGNVSSITDNGTGDYTVNFTNAMPDANYSVAFNNHAQADHIFVGGVLTYATGSVRCYFGTTGAVGTAANTRVDATNYGLSIFR